MAEENNTQTGQNKDAKIRELEQKLSEQGNKLSQAEEDIQAATAMANIIAYNPELKEHFVNVRDGRQYSVAKETLSEQQQEKPKKEDTPKKPPTQTNRANAELNEVKESQREILIREFEKKHGLDQLPDKEKKAARQKIEKTLNDFGSSVKSAPLSSLDKQLESAYLSTHAEKLKEDGKLEGYAQYAQNQQGAMGAMKGGKEILEETEGLTDRQIEWAKRLGVDPKKAEKTFSGRGEEAETDPVEARKEEE